MKISNKLRITMKSLVWLVVRMKE